MFHLMKGKFEVAFELVRSGECKIKPQELIG